MFMEQKQRDRKQRAVNSSMNPDVNTRTEGFIDDPAGGDENEVIDEEELNKIRELKNLKAEYRKVFNNLKNFKNEATFTANAIDNAKQQLVEGFEQWYEDNFEAKKTVSSPKKITTPTPQGKMIRDPAMDEDEEDNSEEEQDGVTTDKDALAYIRSRKQVHKLHAAAKLM